MRWSLLSSALVASLIGYGASVGIILAAAQALGASQAQIMSWLLAICLAKAIGSAWLSWSSKIPVVLAWSTPGAAMVAASQGITINQAVAGFALCGLLIVLTGLWRPLGRLIAKIPDPIAAGMLGGVLLPFCLLLPDATLQSPWVVGPMILVFIILRLFNPALAVLGAIAGGILCAVLSGEFGPYLAPENLPKLVWISPELGLAGLLGIGVPLYLVTMASQNLPGFATLRAAGYEPPVQPALLVTGGLSALIAPFGAHTVSMAAITAAICLGDDTHPDRTQRWKVGLIYGLVWAILGLLGMAVLALFAALPPAFLTAVVALALLGPLLGACSGAFAVAELRFPALVTLVTTASGTAFFGIGSAFWGLLAGLLLYALDQARTTWKKS